MSPEGAALILERRQANTLGGADGMGTAIRRAPIAQGREMTGPSRRSHREIVFLERPLWAHGSPLEPFLSPALSRNTDPPAGDSTGPAQAASLASTKPHFPALW